MPHTVCAYLLLFVIYSQILVDRCYFLMPHLYWHYVEDDLVRIYHSICCVCCQIVVKKWQSHCSLQVYSDVLLMSKKYKLIRRYAPDRLEVLPFTNKHTVCVRNRTFSTCTDTYL